MSVTLCNNYIIKTPGYTFLNEDISNEYKQNITSYIFNNYNELLNKPVKIIIFTGSCFFLPKSENYDYSDFFINGEIIENEDNIIDDEDDEVLTYLLEKYYCVKVFDEASIMDLLYGTDHD